MREHRGPLALIGIVGLVLSGFALTVDYPRAAGAFWSDAATYYTMAHSLAFDSDLRFAREDLERVYREFRNGPSGIFLKRGREVDAALTSKIPFLESRGPLTDELYFAKAFLYSLSAAPLVRLFGTNGLLLFHALLVTVVLSSAYFFLVAGGSKIPALTMAVTFFAASVVPAYFVWLTPELFNLCLVFLGAFFWLYKERDDFAPRFLSGALSDAIAAGLFGAATYSKLSNILLVLPLVALQVFRRQWKRAVVTGGAFALVMGGLFLVQFGVTGEMNYQGGERKTFGGRYPYQQADWTFENTGLPKVTSEIYTYQPWDIVLHDLYFYVIGRFSGVAIYCFPAVAAVIVFLASRNKRPYQWLVLATAIVGCLLFIVWMPVNYFGGGGTLGNRYFLNIFPLFFFLLSGTGRLIAPAMMSWAVAALFLTTILVSPFEAGRRPGEHAAQGVFKWLPPELSLINDLPTNNDPEKFRQRFDDGYLGYFLDNNTWGRERRAPGGLGFHVKGGTEAEVVVRTGVELEKIVVRVTNVASKANRVRVCVPGGCENVELPPGSKEILELPAGRPFPYEDFGHRSYCYLVAIRTETGSVPLLDRRGETDWRYLGAFVHILPDPYPGI
ncbi:MAG TPA: hypothetical protein VLK65_14275 [Vicinamibacteria bacterium]|nr:hypothetical protein [Vicinamibacteria bacterium]